jgi:hypothetical protein
LYMSLICNNSGILTQKINTLLLQKRLQPHTRRFRNRQEMPHDNI